MRAEDFEQSDACRRLTNSGLLTFERFGDEGRAVVCLAASLKGVQYCCDHLDEADKDVLGFKPLF